MFMTDTISDIFSGILPAFGAAPAVKTAAREECPPRVAAAEAKPFAISVQQSAIGPVGVIAVNERLDGSNYMHFINKVDELWDGGVRRIIVDVSKMPGFGLTAVYALQAAASITRGQAYPASDLGSRAVRRLCELNVAEGRQNRVLLVDRSDRDADALEAGGIRTVFPIYSSEAEALAFCNI